MSYWLLKTEPATYSWETLAHEKKARWDGVTNALALKHIRSMKKGDQAIIYHTGDERAAVGIAEITTDPYPDPAEADPKIVVVDLKAKRKLARPVTLAEFKSDKAFVGWDLLRIGRLSVVPVLPTIWERIEKMAGQKNNPLEK
jgi:predicted RNA-binding protein with PUA-like domain